MKYVMLIGRILFSWIFISAVKGHFTQNYIGFAAASGVPLPSFAVPLSGIIAFTGGLSIAAGYKAKWGAWLIIIFLIPVTLIMHRFWNIQNPAASQMQYVQFIKNISMLGGSIFIAYFGSGPFSLDNWLRKRFSDASSS